MHLKLIPVLAATAVLAFAGGALANHVTQVDPIPGQMLTPVGNLLYYLRYDSGSGTRSGSGSRSGSPRKAAGGGATRAADDAPSRFRSCVRAHWNRRRHDAS